MVKKEVKINVKKEVKKGVPASPKYLKFRFKGKEEMGVLDLAYHGITDKVKPNKIYEIPIEKRDLIMSLRLNSFFEEVK